MITVTDIFAGAGGSTSGAIMVPGVEVRVSANHWQLAVDVLIRTRSAALPLIASGSLTKSVYV